MRRSAHLALALAAALAGGLLPALAGRAAAQQETYTIRGAPAWLGISYDARWVLAGEQCTPRVVVEAVVQGSPAERAGLRTGDAITAVDGEPVPPGRLQALAARLVPGDSVRLRFVRNGESREVTAVADRRPDRPLTVFLERSTSLRSMGSPVIEVRGDTLVAPNAAEWDPGRVHGYWLRHAGGTEYRTLGSWSADDLDRRVADLLSCADSLQIDPPAWVDRRQPERGTLREFQARTDSLRVLMSRRAAERAGGLRTDSLWVTITRTDSLAGVLFRGSRTPGVWQVQRGPGDRLRTLPADSGFIRLYRGPDSGAVEIVSPGIGYAMSIEDHVAMGLRGVAGAELTPLEPELAEYFRNADRGLLVLRIAPGTPAGRAGLRPGDVILAADGRKVESVAELRQIIALPTANAVELRIIRRGRTRELVLQRK